MEKQPTDTADLSRYSRQMRYPGIGEEGQKRLLASRALICGCGALGSVLANTLVRAGVGHVRIVDRDFLELNNLQRQILYDEDDVAAGIPKAIAAQRRLERINSQVKVEAIVADVDASNIGSLVEGVDIILDGTDNFETRFLLNDASLKYGIPWVYGGCIGAEGQTMTVLPGKSPCLRCFMAEAPPPGSTPTCDSAGILAPIINVIASIEAAEALKILAGHSEAVSKQLSVIELWENRLRQISIANLFSGFENCACRGKDFPWLEGDRGTRTAVLCGRNAVQLSFPEKGEVSFEQLAAKLSPLGRVEYNRYLLRFEVDQYTLTVFRDGRTIVGGTDDIAEARTIHARYIGA